jgi:hypothetical protein
MLGEWVSNEKLRLHMKQAADESLGYRTGRADQRPPRPGNWQGAYHADWENIRKAIAKIIEELERLRIDPTVIRCIASHGPKYFGVEPVSKMENDLRI